MPLFKIRRTGQLGFFSDKARPSPDMYNDKSYYFLQIVDPINTDWDIATLPRYYKFTGDQARYSASELLPIQTKDLKKAQKNNTLDKLMEPETINESAEMAQSDVTKIVDYSEKLQSMFDVNDNLEDWVKAKLNHACDYVATVRDYLKFYRDEKEAGTPDDQIDEKWTNKYKKSIDCSNAKGFSQKAHCKARRLRQMGKKTKSKPVREIYEAVVRHMLKEFNSSMAMGALKQLNSDAKELETMLQPNSELEDWVKAKLNLAGEYLDDVYHHLDHFGPQGRKFDEVKVAHDLEEGWKDWVAAGAIGLGAMSGKVDASKMKPADQAAITQSVQKSVGSFMDYIKKVENQGKVGYNSEKKLWFPHKSFEGGSDTIGYGHKIQKGEDFSKGITDAQAESLLKTDLSKAKQQVYKELGSIKLTPQQEEMFVDFVFNMGTLKKFPKFTEFALKNDLEGMKSQYKRYAGGKELKGRNSEFLKRFLSEYFGFTTYF
jgi:GH24 family phage-related lysozyme (muramidase)